MNFKISFIKFGYLFPILLCAILIQAGPVFADIPTIVSEKVESVAVGYTYEYDVDANGNPVPTYELDNQAPTTMVIDDQTGEIEWFPNVLQKGVHDFSVKAVNIDGEGTQALSVEAYDLCSDDMLAYWRMDEAGSPFGDSIGTNPAECTSCPDDIVGQIDSGKDFDGTDEVDVDDDLSVFNWTDANSFSIEFWMRRGAGAFADNDSEVIIGRDNSGDTNLYWWVGLNGRDVGDIGKAEFMLVDENKKGVDLRGTVALTDNTWHHVVAVRDDLANKNLIYVDGELQNSITPVENYTGGFGTTEAVNLGYLNFNTGSRFHFTGDLDEVAVYDFALTAAIIKQHYSQDAANGYCNDSPVISTDAILTADEGQEYIYDADGTDAEGDTLTWSLEEKPVGMAIEAATGVITWTPGNLIAAADVILVVEDGNGGAASQDFTILVNPSADDVDDDDNNGGGGGGGGGSCFIGALK